MVKQICEEREFPTQILLPAMDQLFCPLLNVAIFVESHAPSGFHLYGDYLNRSFSNILENILSSKHFTAIYPGSLGTHSIRKGLQPMQVTLCCLEIE